MLPYLVSREAGEIHSKTHRMGTRNTLAQKKITITPDDGYLGSWIDEERSEMRYVMRIAELRESSNL